MDFQAMWNDPFAALSSSLTSGGRGARNRAFQAQQDQEHWGRVQSFQDQAFGHERTMQADRFNHEQTVLGAQHAHEVKMTREHGRQHRLNVDQAHHLPGGSTVQWGPGSGMVSTPLPKTRKPKAPPAP